MPPKPRGLKASKAKAAFVPDEPTDDSTSSSSEPTVRTYPHDEDALTLQDLFTLRLSALAALALNTAEAQDEARGLLRGILHGCDGLSTLLASTPSEELETDRMEALGLSSPRAKSELAYLQAWSLYSLSTILPPPSRPSALASSSAVTEGSKKRKVDLSEPTTEEEWLDGAIERYSVALSAARELADEGMWTTLLLCGQLQSHIKRSGLHFDAEEESKGRETLEGILAEFVPSLTELVDTSLTSHKDDTEYLSDFVERHGALDVAVLAALRSMVSLVDFYREIGMEERAEVLEDVSAYLPSLALVHVGEEEGGLEVDIVGADAAMALFVLREEEVEETFRPDEEGEEEYEEDDEDADVKPLPLDDEMVIWAKEKGELGESLLHPACDCTDTRYSYQVTQRDHHKNERPSCGPTRRI